MYILIFKTNIDNEHAQREVAAVLDAEASIVGWNVDLEDIDKVLRIESSSNSTSHIIHKVSQAGFFCEELPD